jgi:carbamoyl-phosphate synthase large subunit
MRLLVTAGGGAASEYLVRHWGTRHELHFGEMDPDKCPPTVPPDRRHRLPAGTAAEFAEELALLCKRLRIDVLVPGADEELPAAAALDVPGMDVLCPDAAFVRWALDKQATAEGLRDAGLPAPESRLLSDVDPMALRYPVIVKPRSGRGSRGVARIADARALAAYLVLSPLASEQLVAQEALEGQEYTVAVVANRDGALRAVVPVEVFTKVGITLHAATRATRAVIDGCVAIHAARPTRATYNVQCVLTRDGRLVPFEINPRISTTIALVLAAGVDPVELYASAAGPLAPFTEGLVLRRRWLNEIARP